MKRPNLFKFNLLLWAFFSALFGSIMAVLNKPLWIGCAAAAILVWGYNIVAGAFFRWKDRDCHASEISAQSAVFDEYISVLEEVGFEHRDACKIVALRHNAWLRGGFTSAEVKELSEINQRKFIVFRRAAE